MTVAINSDSANIPSVNYGEQAANIATPGAGRRQQFFKAHGLYSTRSDGIVVPPYFYYMSEYGAKNDGSNDASVAHNDIVSDIQASGGGGIILWGPGQYKIDNPCVIDDSGGFGYPILNLGYGANILPANGVTCFHAIGPGGFQSVIYDGFEYDGTGTTGSTFIQIENMIQGATIRNCGANLGANGLIFLNSGSAGHFTESVTVQNFWHFGATTAGITFTRTGGDPSQAQPRLYGVGLSECATGILMSGGVDIERSQFDAVTIWVNSGQTGINASNAIVKDSRWNVNFEAPDGIGGTSMNFGASTTGMNTLAVNTGFVNWPTAPAYVDNADFPLNWYLGAFIPYYCKAYNNAALSIPTGSNTALTLNSEIIDTDGIHSTSVNTSRLTCQHAGIYAFTANAAFAASAAGSIRIIQLRINGTNFIALQNGPFSAAQPTYLSVTGDYPMAVGDYVEAVVLQDTGGALNIVQGSNWSPFVSMKRIG